MTKAAETKAASPPRPQQLAQEVGGAHSPLVGWGGQQAAGPLLWFGACAPLLGSGWGPVTPRLGWGEMREWEVTPWWGKSDLLQSGNVKSGLIAMT